MSDFTRTLTHSLFILGLSTPLALAGCGEDTEGDGDTGSGSDSGTGTGTGGDDGDDGDDGDSGSSGGDDGSSDDGDSGSSGDSGSDSGDSGSGDSGSDSGDSGSGNGDSGSSTGDSGSGSITGDDGYPDCDDSGGGPTCDGNAQCVEDDADDHDNLRGRVCTSECGDVGDCPDPNSGEAVPLCADLSPDGMSELYCVLDCEGSNGVDGAPVDCPNGMVCGAYQVHEPPGGGNPLEWRRICIWEG